MKGTGIILLLTFLSRWAVAQERQYEPEPVNEQQLESQAERDEGVMPDDGYWQQLHYLQKHPLNLNEAGEEDLKNLQLLTGLQISRFLQYRKILGPLVSVYELQAIPGWDVATIRRLLPFITVREATPVPEYLGRRFTAGDHTILLRLAQVAEKAKGYEKTATGSLYTGPAQAILFKYGYRYKNDLQWGVISDKDAGEPFANGFYSFHLFVKKTGMVQSLAIGDFTVRMGQGLIQWQGLAFKQTAQVLNIKRQGMILQPYHSSGEYNFHRGIGVTLQRKNIQCTLFGSLRKLSANTGGDSLSNESYISSFITSGYYRSSLEQSKQNNVRCITGGGNMRWNNGRVQLGLNAVLYQFSKPLEPSGRPYDLFAVNERRWANYSIDYSYTIRNMHWFGEAAVDKNSNLAIVSGCLASVDPKVDLAFLYRNISPGYQSFFSNAFTENTLPVNENGWYAGMSIRPVSNCSIDVYADVARFPWLKYQSDAPGSACAYLVQISCTPAKHIEIYTRYRYETRWMNETGANTAMKPVTEVPRHNWRTQVNYELSRHVELRSRVEAVWYAPGKTQQETGFLFFTDLYVQPFLKNCSLNGRLEYVETGGYNSRIYAWENSVLYNFSIPALYNKQLRYLLNVSGRLDKLFWKGKVKRTNARLACSFAQSVYPSKTIIGSGNDMIEGKTKTEIKCQLLIEINGKN